MSTEESRTEYVVLQPITTKRNVIVWFRIGRAFRNPDGSIDAYVDAVVANNRFRLRERDEQDDAEREKPQPS